MNLPFILHVLALTTLFACNTPKVSTNKSAKDPQEAEWVIKFQRGPCFGDCPVYTFYLMSDHNGLIESRQNLLEPGWYHADLDQETVHEILMDIESERWWNEDLRNEPEIADLPSTSILYKHKDGLRRKSITSRMTDQSSRILRKFSTLVSDTRWEPTNLRPLHPDLPEPTEVIVQLKENVSIKTWMTKYESFGIRLVRRVSPNMSFYVVAKDPQKRAANDFLQYIKLDPDVIEAQWDRPLTTRGE